MKALFALTALIAAAPLAAQAAHAETVFSSPEAEVRAAADTFFEALASSDKTALADHMLPEGVIFIHNQMDADNPRVDAVPVSQHLERWAKGTRAVREVMTYETVLVDWDMAHLWGPYTFWADGEITHCGINSLSMVRTKKGWKIANTSFSMVEPSQCKFIDAPAMPNENSAE